MFRHLAVALAATLVSVAPALAGFGGDSLTVSLTVHTTGAADQTVFSLDPAVGGPGVELTGDSDPGALGDALAWSLDFDGDCFTLTVTNSSGSAQPIGDLSLIVDDIDMALPGLTIGLNTLGIGGGDISIVGDSIVISSTGLADVAALGSASVEICVVPEASTFVMMSIMAAGVAGGYVARRRRNG